LFAKSTRRLGLAGIKGRSGAANDVLGGVLVHAGTLEQRSMIARKGQRGCLQKSRE
jgi:hypothetical protein